MQGCYDQKQKGVNGGKLHFEDVGIVGIVFELTGAIAGVEALVSNVGVLTVAGEALVMVCRASTT